MATLRLSTDVSLPPAAVTETFGVLAQRGAGKSNTAAVMAEEMFRAGLPFVVVDPVGSWYGLRSSRDGKHAGLAIPVFGGKHADVPIERGGGKLIADLVVDQRLSCILDLTTFDSEASKKHFLIDFAKRLYDRNEEPLHLFLEEADDYIPQKPMHDEQHLLRAWENIVRRGRSRGLGMTIITQRSAAVNKSVLTQVGTLIAMRTTGPQDRAAIAEWLKFNGQSQEILESLPGLADGEAWVWSPRFLGRTVRTRFRQRETFDSGATPEVASKRRATTLADVDLEGVRTAMKETIERAEAEDPKKLRARVAQLERELAAAKAAPTKTERVEVPAFSPGELGQLGRLEELLREATVAVQAAMRRVSAAPPPARAAIARPATVPAPAKRAPPQRATTGDASLPGGQRRILTALAQYEGGRTKRQVAVLCGYAITGGGFNNNLGALRSRGFIEGSDPLLITDVGWDALGSFEPLPTGADLLEHWRGQLGKAERAALDVLAGVFPRSMAKEAVAEAAGYEASGGGFNNALGRLRTLELITGRGELRASEELFG